MNKAYVFLLKKRYRHQWKNFKEKLKYFFDFSILYVIVLVGFFIALYKDIWNNPPIIIQGIASLLHIIPMDFWFSLALFLFIIHGIKGLTSSPICFTLGDTYFLFTLPIPKKHYVFFEWIVLLGKRFFIMMVGFFLGAPILHLLWPNWFVPTVKLLLTLFGFSICLINIQWLCFQLPLSIKRNILLILGYIKKAFLIALAIIVLVMGFMVLFSNRDIPDIPLESIKITPFPFDVNQCTWVLVFIFIITSILSIYYVGRVSLESLKDSSIHQNRVKTFLRLGMKNDLKMLTRKKGGRDKKFFLSIPGFYKNSKIFLWRNLSRWIKQPLQYLHPYFIYGGLNVGIILSLKGEAISLVFIFFALYILGQSMALPLKEDYEANYFLSSFPIRSINILRGYLMLPTIFSTIIGIIFCGLIGKMLGNLGMGMILILNLPFFTYFTLLASMKNVLEDINLALTVNKTLHMEAFLLIRGAVPIIFGMLFSKEGIPFPIIGISSALAYFFMAKGIEKDVVASLKMAFHKYR